MDLSSLLCCCPGIGLNVRRFFTKSKRSNATRGNLRVVVSPSNQNQPDEQKWDVDEPQNSNQCYGVECDNHSMVNQAEIEYDNDKVNVADFRHNQIGLEEDTFAVSSARLTNSDQLPVPSTSTLPDGILIPHNETTVDEENEDAGLIEEVDTMASVEELENVPCQDTDPSATQDTTPAFVCSNNSNSSPAEEQGADAGFDKSNGEIPESNNDDAKSNKCDVLPAVVQIEINEIRLATADTQIKYFLFTCLVDICIIAIVLYVYYNLCLD